MVFVFVVIFVIFFIIFFSVFDHQSNFITIYQFKIFSNQYIKISCIKYDAMAITGLELQYMINHITKMASGYYVSNIYGINTTSLLFKLHHTEKPDIYLVVSTFGIWTTNTKITNIEHNKLLKRLRSDLIRSKFLSISQIELERIAYITFHNHENEIKLIVEFFGGGNIILCNNEMKILAMLHSVNVRHRQLRIGVKYEDPPKNCLNILELDKGQLFNDISKATITVGKFIGRTYGITSKYLDIIFTTSKINPLTLCNELNSKEITSVFNAINEIVDNVIKGKHDPAVIKVNNNELDIITIKKNSNNIIKSMCDFNDCLDFVFTKKFIENKEAIKTTDIENKSNELRNKIREQSNAINIVKTKSMEISELARSLSRGIKDGIVYITNPNIVKILNKHKANITYEKGIKILKINNKKIKLKDNISLHAIISLLYDEAKKQIKAIDSIENIKINTEKQLSELECKSVKIKTDISFSKIRKKKWFERYRWCYTREGLLAVGGRDASSNSAIIRKHLTKNDIVFHADIFGSPFFVLKNGASASTETRTEVANITACFSRAWRESTYGLNVYWVYPSQIRKSAPSGQFLSKGSFSIEGKRNYVSISKLELAIGIGNIDDNVVAITGSPNTIMARCKNYVIIAPNGEEISETTKKIKHEFSKIYSAKNITLDDIIKCMPSGKSHMVKTKMI